MSNITKIAALVMLSAALLVAFGGCASSRRSNASGQASSPSQIVSPAEVNRMIYRTRRALRADPHNARLHFELAGALQAVGDKSRYLEHIKLAARLAPKNSLYQFGLAEAYRAQGLKGLALKKALHAAEIGAGDAQDMTPLYYQLVAELEAETGKHAAAEHWYEKALAAFSAYQGVAACTRNDEIPKRWRSTIERIGSRLAGVQRGLGERRPSQQWLQANIPWFRFGRPERGAQVPLPQAEIGRLTHKLASQRVVGSGIHIDLGALLLTVGQTGSAIVEFLAAVEIDGKQSKAWQMLGAAYVRQGRLDEALAAFDKSCKLGNQDSCVLYRKTREAIQRLKTCASGVPRAD